MDRKDVVQIIHYLWKKNGDLIIILIVYVNEVFLTRNDSRDSRLKEISWERI